MRTGLLCLMLLTAACGRRTESVDVSKNHDFIDSLVSLRNKGKTLRNEGNLSLGATDQREVINRTHLKRLLHSHHFSMVSPDIAKRVYFFGELVYTVTVLRNTPGRSPEPSNCTFISPFLPGSIGSLV